VVTAVTVRLAADRDRCIGSGRCMATDPDVFDSDDDGIVVIARPEPDPEHDDLVREAVFLCPARALSLVE
jgi:ferredoxin